MMWPHQLLRTFAPRTSCLFTLSTRIFTENLMVINMLRRVMPPCDYAYYGSDMHVLFYQEGCVAIYYWFARNCSIRCEGIDVVRPWRQWHSYREISWHHRKRTRNRQLTGPWEISIWFLVDKFQANFSEWWLRYLLWNCPQMNSTRPYWW